MNFRQSVVCMFVLMISGASALFSMETINYDDDNFIENTNLLGNGLEKDEWQNNDEFNMNNEPLSIGQIEALLMNNNEILSIPVLPDTNVCNNHTIESPDFKKEYTAFLWKLKNTVLPKTITYSKRIFCDLCKIYLRSTSKSSAAILRNTFGRHIIGKHIMKWNKSLYVRIYNEAKRAKNEGKMVSCHYCTKRLVPETSNMYTHLAAYHLEKIFEEYGKNVPGDFFHSMQEVNDYLKENGLPPFGIKE